MTFARVALWTCDRCSVRVHINGPEGVLDDHMPEGWAHTMDGRDLCPYCQGRQDS